MNGFSAAIVLATLLMSPLTAMAQLKVIISGGFSGPYERVLPEFERTTGIKVTTGSGSSQGTGPQTMAAQLASGAAYDVVILSREGLEDLMKAGRIAAGTDVDLARTPIGVAVRAGTPKPDVSTVEAFKRVVLNARAVAVPSSTSGIFLINEVFPRLGIADKVNVKRTPRGSGAPAMVVAGEADIAVLPVSEIVHAPGVELAGVIAQEIQLNQIFAAAIVAGSKEVEAAKRLIGFLTSDAAASAIRAGGMEP
ncbi:MAG TPA: substrate-binding domain-containing protein, partial [Burkholderiales bacterium]|nr:substrate-binding domain-containing protein [Burkholderiales bacterium]